MIASTHVRRLIRFATVGVGAVLLLFVLVWFLSAAGMAPFPAAVLGYALAFVCAYTLQRNWTFGGAHDHRRAFPRYLAAQLVCAGLSGLVGHAVEVMLAAPAFWMAAAVALTAGTASYLLSSLWVFAETRG